MYLITVQKNHVETFRYEVKRKEEIRHVLEIGDDEPINIDNGIFIYDPIEGEVCSVMQVNKYHAVQVLETGSFLPVNRSTTHTLYNGEICELFEDQSGDWYFHYANAEKSHNVLYVRPLMY